MVQDLATVFDFATSFGVTFLFFILPSLFMILTLQQFPKGQLLFQQTEGILLKVMAYLVMAIGIVVFVCTALVTFVDLERQDSIVGSIKD
jgi:hypothetical protein